jgi:predicted enzyme related to lactoylglutathione lyase
MTTASTPALTITGMDLIGATVPDLQRSLAFYRDQLGLIPTVEADGGAEFHLADGTTFGLWQPPADAGFPYHFSIMFTVADAKAASERFRELGATIGEPMESPVCHMALGTDPEGNSFILHQRKSVDAHRPPSIARTATTINGIDIAGYLVADPQGESAFYREVLGLVPSDVDEQGRGTEFTFPDGSSFGVWRTPEGTKCGFVMFAVEDAQAKVDQLRARGVQLEDVIETPVCFMSYTMDPDGNGVIIHERKTR